MVATAPFKGVAIHNVLLNHNHMDPITVRWFLVFKMLTSCENTHVIDINLYKRRTPKLTQTLLPL